jgi:hypothetical protein
MDLVPGVKQKPFQLRATRTEHIARRHLAPRFVAERDVRCRGEAGGVRCVEAGAQNSDRPKPTVYVWQARNHEATYQGGFFFFLFVCRIECWFGLRYPST